MGRFFLTMTEADIPARIERDAWMMSVLRAAAALALPDWWIGAGFVRNKVWDVLHGVERRPHGDIDLVYFDPSDRRETTERCHDARLETLFATGEWSSKNLARMHEKNGDAPYASALDGIAHWPETATAVAVKLDDAGRVVVRATHGADDLLGLTVRPTPKYQHRLDVYRARIAGKRWEERWPKLRFLER